MLLKRHVRRRVHGAVQTAKLRTIQCGQPPQQKLVQLGCLRSITRCLLWLRALWLRAVFFWSPSKLVIITKRIKKAFHFSRCDPRRCSFPLWRRSICSSCGTGTFVSGNLSRPTLWLTGTFVSGHVFSPSLFLGSNLFRAPLCLCLRSKVFPGQVLQVFSFFQEVLN